MIERARDEPHRGGRLLAVLDHDAVQLALRVEHQRGWRAPRTPPCRSGACRPRTPASTTPVRNAAGTSRSPPSGPRRESRSAPTSTEAGSCQLGPPSPSPPTVTGRWEPPCPPGRTGCRAPRRSRRLVGDELGARAAGSALVRHSPRVVRRRASSPRSARPPPRGPPRSGRALGSSGARLADDRSPLRHRALGGVGARRIAPSGIVIARTDPIWPAWGSGAGGPTSGWALVTISPTS